MNINLYQILLKKDHSTSEMMFLDITKNGSKYYRERSLCTRFHQKADIEKQMKTGNFKLQYQEMMQKVK